MAALRSFSLRVQATGESSPSCSTWEQIRKGQQLCRLLTAPVKRVRAMWAGDAQSSIVGHQLLKTSTECSRSWKTLKNRSSDRKSTLAVASG